ncbi:MAG: hypothetical protein ABI818_11715 [Acidobacteriota bacterium]
MSKPQPVLQRPGADELDDFRGEIEIVNERDKDYAAQRAAARPAEEVVERLLRRHSAL